VGILSLNFLNKRIYIIGSRIIRLATDYKLLLKFSMLELIVFQKKRGVWVFIRRAGIALYCGSYYKPIQAVKRGGDFLMDCRVIRNGNHVHVLNATSPGAIASLAKANYTI
jgi:hypothetical protein